jgi:O-methyltransferase involved in polyketide biosynthesis
MNNKLHVELGPVQETLLIPLLGRAEETRKKRGLVQDLKAIEIVDSLDYDFSKWRGIRSLVGTSIRTRMFDEEVSAFLRAHPGGTVIEIGAGLNTRYERLDNGQAHWLELDLPDSMALRRRFFQDTRRRTMVAASALEDDWHARVLGMPRPYYFVSEAVIIYLEREHVEAMLRGLAERFPGAWLLTDTTSSKMVDGQAKHDAMKKLPKDAWFRWRCDDPKSLERLKMRLERSRTFADAPPDVVSAMPLPYRVVLSVAPWLLRRQVDGYRINRFRFAGGQDP